MPQAVQQLRTRIRRQARRKAGNARSLRGIKQGLKFFRGGGSGVRRMKMTRFPLFANVLLLLLLLLRACAGRIIRRPVLNQGMAAQQHDIQISLVIQVANAFQIGVKALLPLRGIVGGFRRELRS